MARAVAEFQSLLAGLAGELQEQIAEMVPKLLTELDQPELLTFITDAYPELVGPYLAASSDLTATWYEDQLPTADFLAAPIDLPTADQLAADARTALLQDSPAVALGGVASGSVFDVSRETVSKNAEREGVRWALHASANACGWCRMRATRGATYTSRKAAQASHGGCHCVAVPDRGDGSFIEAPYIAQWRKDYGNAIRAGARTPGEIANEMDYAPGGRRYNPDKPRKPRKRYRDLSPRPVNLDALKPQSRNASRAESDSKAATAKRLLPGLEVSLANLRAKGLPEDSPQIQYHMTQIAKLRAQLNR